MRALKIDTQVEKQKLNLTRHQACMKLMMELGQACLVLISSLVGICKGSVKLERLDVGWVCQKIEFDRNLMLRLRQR